MDDGEFTPDSEFSGAFSGAAMDLDFMDELLFDGCWLETADKLNLSQQPCPSTSGGQNDSPRQYLPFVEFNNSHLTVNHPQQTYQELIGKSNSGNAPLNSPKLEELVDTSQNQNLLQFGSLPNGGNEIGRSLWFAPRENSAAASSVTDRLLNAITHLKGSTKDRDVLMQIWVPVKKGGKRVLSTTGQPFFLNPNYKSLESYRSISERYYFQAEADSKDLAGLPGRVFLRKLPEWTPDVRFFRTNEYPRKDHAKQCNISGSLAVPVLERGSRTCLGVVEVVTTTQDIDCHPDLQNICQALEAFDLTGAQDFCPPSVKACKEFCQALVPELSEILGSVCSANGLPLALTWAPCFRQGKGGCRHFNEKYARSISTVDSACFVADKDLLRFHAACSKQYLFLGQGIVGRAFLKNKQCFASNITAFCQTDYPFAHHAKMFGLRAAVAIPLRAADAESPDFVLELFLPKGCQGTEEQERVWESLSVAIQQACRSLQVLMDKEIQEDVSSQIVGAADGRHNREETQKFVSSLSKDPSPKESSWFSQMMEAQQKGKAIQVSWDCPKEEPKGEFRITTQWDNTYPNAVLPEYGQVQKKSQLKGGVESAKCSSFSGNHLSGNRKPGEKRRTKTEKKISLDVLRQYFAGSLKDAAKSIGVCPTTLKRICRQHGITRWPSRKLKKVGHSLKKLQLVIDSVQGAEGAIQIESFYTAFPELTSPKYSGSGPLLSFKTGDDSKQPIPQPENGGTGSKSLSSSSSQSSGSSHCCSTEVKQNTTISNDVSGNGDAQMVGDPGSLLKRTHSDAELHALVHEEPKLLVRSHSHKTFGDHPNLETLPPLPKSSGRILLEQGVFKVNTTFGDDKIRFGLPPNWSFRDLQQEIAKRFKIEDVSRIDLKYLDDDNEWVLLTCDPDLEECKEVYRLSQGHTIKISLHQASQAHLGSLSRSEKLV